MGQTSLYYCTKCHVQPTIENTVVFGKVVWRARCPGCGLRTQIVPSPEAAIQLWNGAGKGAKHGIH